MYTHQNCLNNHTMRILQITGKLYKLQTENYTLQIVDIANDTLQATYQIVKIVNYS